MSESPSPDLASEVDLRARLARAEQFLREEGHHALASELTLGLLHKLNNLMTGVYFNLEHAEAALDPAHPASGILREVTTSIQQAQALVRRTADLNLPPEPEASYFDIGPLIEENWDLIKIILPKSTTSELKRPSEPLYVKVSSEEFCEALLQLASATRAGAPSGQTQVSIEVLTAEAVDVSGFLPAAQPVQGHVAVLYRDNAGEPGSPKDEFPFRAYTTERGGGLNHLFRARELINRQNGSLAVRTIPGGMEFLLLLPIVS